MIDTNLTLYDPHPPHSSIFTISASLNFSALTSTSTSASPYLAAKGVIPLFTHELVEPATRMNDGQNVDAIHALEGMVSLVATGEQSVLGRNGSCLSGGSRKSERIFGSRLWCAR